jgi:mRNA interferase RelE/StbE
MKQIRYEKAALKYLQKLDQKTAARIVKAIRLFADTGEGDVKFLTGRPNHSRLRVGSYRVIFTYENGQLVIVVLNIGPRGDVYKS